MRSHLVLGQVGGLVTRASHDCLPNLPLIQALLVLIPIYTFQRTLGSFPGLPLLRELSPASRKLIIRAHHFPYRVRHPGKAKTFFQNYHLTVLKDKRQALWAEACRTKGLWVLRNWGSSGACLPMVSLETGKWDPHSLV